MRVYERLRLHREFAPEELAPVRAPGQDWALLPDRRLARVDPPVEIAGGVRACVGEDGEDSFAVLWIPASEFRETRGSMDWGSAFGIFDGGALGPLLVPGSVPQGAAREPSAESRASATVEIPEEGIWYAWARVRYPLAVDHSFWLIAEEQSAILGNCGRNGGAWHWTGRGDGLESAPPGSPIPIRLPAGRVRISLAPREGGSDPGVRGRVHPRGRGARNFVTSFLLDRNGRLVGKYRKSHKLADEDMDLGDRESRRPRSGT